MSEATTAQPDSVQHRLSDFLYAELLHTLGAYQSASEKLGGLLARLPGEDEKEGPGEAGSKEEVNGRPPVEEDEPPHRAADESLGDAVEQAIRHNTLLREHLHRPHHDEADGAHRHPSPIQPGEKPDPDLLVPVRQFYASADRALRDHLRATKEGRTRPETSGELLGMHLARSHDPQRRPMAKPTAELIEGRRERTRYRLEKVERVQRQEPPPTSGNEVIEADSAAAVAWILEDNLSVAEAPKPQKPLHLTIVEAMSDAHKWMHQAEHLRSRAFGRMFTGIAEAQAEMQSLLERSIELNTFVYVAARSAPWVFAEDDDERRQVVESFSECCENLTPTYCMWIGNQLGLLALERRAYTWWTLGRHDLAYGDFHKLIRLLRGLRRQVSRRAMRVPGTKTLIEGLTATADHHIGRIYRGQHAHRVALRYFDRASNRMAPWEGDPEIGSILKNSRWRVNGLISQGKANYELGRMKTSLLYYARAWRAFLQLAESESHATANFDVVTELIGWLESIAGEPALSKAELSERLEPLVGQFETVYSPVHLRLLAAEIMMRLGHLLYLLKLPPLDWTLPADLEELPPKPDHELSRRCMFQAAALDPTSTLIATDLLKIHHGVREAEKNEPAPDPPRDPADRAEEPEPEDEESAYPSMALIADQWPAGGSRFEEAVRVIEYIIQTWLEALDRSDQDDGEQDWPRAKREAARELLRTFLAHADSSNVKLAQVYRYLMQPPREAARNPGDSAPTIEVVCLRRYSSFFPFLPRPAAFHALGGGYLVQVRDEGTEEPFGIAVDPGPNFLDNLYRCGYALSDLHMIVLTHDHADHIASVDALLALMDNRQRLEVKKTFGPDKRLAIIGNESVVKRYRFFNEDHPVKKRVDEDSGKEVDAPRPDVVQVMGFEQFKDAAEKILLTPDTLRIEPIRTVDHLDGMGFASQGFRLSIGEGESKSSVVFTSDTGLLGDGPVEPRKDGGPHLAGSEGDASLEQAVADADVVIAHLSSVPMPELRELADLTTIPKGTDGSTAAFEDLWEEAAREAGSQSDDEVRQEGVNETEFLLRQLQFAFRSLGEDERVDISPLGSPTKFKKQPEKHLFLTGLLELAKHMVVERPPEELPLLLIGELREELGTFRTRIASRITDAVFEGGNRGTALTADIGLRVRVSRQGRAAGEPADVSVLCTTCDLDNDLVASERFHPPTQIREVCVKGENEGVFYNCELHDPGSQQDLLWVESVERYNVFGD